MSSFAEVRAAHHIGIKPENRMDNLSSFICRCGVEFPAEHRIDGDIDRHLAQVYVEALAHALQARAAHPDETRLREIAKSTIDRRPYDPHTRHEIRGLENAIAREIAAELAPH